LIERKRSGTERARKEDARRAAKHVHVYRGGGGRA
jgi:hypothetical protein